MSEVKRYDISAFEGGMDEMVDGAWVHIADFDAERALRLEAEKRGDIAQRHLDRMIEHSDSLERQVGELREQLETERMRLVACGVVALANTQDSAKQARVMHPDYESASCSDVADAVDREISLRNKLETAMGFIRRVAAPHSCGCVPCTGDCTSKISLEIIIDEIRGDARAILNTTSTEGKDHE